MMGMGRVMGRRRAGVERAQAHTEAKKQETDCDRRRGHTSRRYSLSMCVFARAPLPHSSSAPTSTRLR